LLSVLVKSRGWFLKNKKKLNLEKKNKKKQKSTSKFILLRKVQLSLKRLVYPPFPPLNKKPFIHE